VDTISDLESQLKEAKEKSEEHSKSASEYMDKYISAMSSLNIKSEEASKAISESQQMQEKNKSLVKCVTDIES
jgi:predicted nuclease with TOPRIM domain